MKPFTFSVPQDVIVGSGSAEKLGEAAKKLGGMHALIISGFGLRSSILYTMSRQYSELFHYTAQVVLSDSVLSEEREAIEEFLTTDTRVTDLARWSSKTRPPPPSAR